MILVTGGTGLIGSHLLLHLTESGKSVRAIYRNASSIGKTKALFHLYNKPALFEKIEWIQADIINIPSLEKAFVGVTHVYHAAALISFDPEDEEKLRKNNIEGTANIINCCLDFNVQKICHISSTSALGDLRQNEIILTEESEWNPEKPHSDYGISKHGAEMEVFRGQQEGLQAVIVNPGIVIGPGFWNSGSGTLFSMIANGMKFYTKGSAGFVDVRDVAILIRMLTDSELSGRFIAISENLTYETVFKATAAALHVKAPGIYARPWMTSVAWRTDWFLGLFGKKRIISKEDSFSLHHSELISNEKVKKTLGFEFRNIHDSIIETARYYPK
ncbi:MAG TPA: NAD-dependent epimerase/dehydratase family protein [Flavobacterium sp.]|jgi:nucleoside-diphosphate-sugar epimerase